MKTLGDIPFAFDAAALMRQLRIEQGSADAADFQSLVRLALQLGHPKAAWDERFIDRKTADGVVIGGVPFASRTLRHNLDAVERVFPFVATCGKEMDEALPRGSDLLRDYWWDTLKGIMLGAALRHTQEHLRRCFRLGQTATMRPGEGDADTWPIAQQRPLFALLGDVRAAIGVELTDSFLMTPNKTASGILYPTQVGFQGCEVCHRKKCPGRRAPFNETLWAEIRQEKDAAESGG